MRVDLVAPARLAHALRPLMPDGCRGGQHGLARGARELRPGQLRGRQGGAGGAHARAGPALGAARARERRRPGLADTPMTAAMPERVLAKLVARVPAGRMAQPDEIAGTVAYLGRPRPPT